MKKRQKLSHLVETRVDTVKYQELKALLDKSAHHSMSELLRDILYNRKIKIITYDKSLDNLMEKLTAIRSELNAIGVNINQVTRYFNADPSPSQKVYRSMQIANLYQSVGDKVEQLLFLISKLGEKWLPK